MVGREPTSGAAEVSRTLREATEPFLPQRRRTIALTLGAMTALAPVVAYQTGLIRHLPDPPGPWFDSDVVDASAEAYRPGSVPDAITGLASYAVTLMLAGKGPAERWRTDPWLPLALAGKVVFDAASAGYLGRADLGPPPPVCLVPRCSCRSRPHDSAGTSRGAGSRPRGTQTSRMITRLSSLTLRGDPKLPDTPPLVTAPSIA